MPKTLRDFGDYLLALWGEWKALVMGGGIFAVIAIIGVATHDSLPINVGYGILGGTFIWAGFLAWRKESQGKSTLQASLAAALKRQLVPTQTNATYQRQGEIFVDETPLFLTKFFKEHTSAQAEKLIAPYMKKWMHLTNVTVHDISGREGTPSISANTQDGVFTTLYFDNQWAERVAVLRRGSRIEVIGKIRRVSNLITLEECEIITSERPSENP